MQLICSAVELCGGIYMIVGDHGNCEDMVQRDVEGNPQLDGCGNPFRKPCHSLHEVLTTYVIKYTSILCGLVLEACTFNLTVPFRNLLNDGITDEN